MRISSGKLLSIRGDCSLLCKLMHFVYMRLRRSRRIYRLNAHMNAASDHIWDTITGIASMYFQLQHFLWCELTIDRSNYCKYAAMLGSVSEKHGLLWDTLVDRRPPLQDARTALTWLPDVHIGKMPIAHSAKEGEGEGTHLLLLCKQLVLDRNHQ